MKYLTCLCAIVFPVIVFGCSSPSETSPISRPETAAPGGKSVTVYYFHRTMRCISCLSIEKMARQTLQEEYAQDLSSGAIRWQPVDYWQDAELAGKFGVDSPTLVVAVMKDGQVASSNRLDKTWSLKGDSRAFRAMLSDAVKEAMAR